jgi:hypothetical protein
MLIRALVFLKKRIHLFLSFYLSGEMYSGRCWRKNTKLIQFYCFCILIATCEKKRRTVPILRFFICWFSFLKKCRIGTILFFFVFSFSCWKKTDLVQFYLFFVFWLPPLKKWRIGIILFLFCILILVFEKNQFKTVWFLSICFVFLSSYHIFFAFMFEFCIFSSRTIWSNVQNT